MVDVENVRGKTNFQQTHETFIARVCALTNSAAKGHFTNNDLSTMSMLLGVPHQDNEVVDDDEELETKT